MRKLDNNIIGYSEGRTFASSFCVSLKVSNMKHIAPDLKKWEVAFEKRCPAYKEWKNGTGNLR